MASLRKTVNPTKKPLPYCKVEEQKLSRAAKASRIYFAVQRTLGILIVVFFPIMGALTEYFAPVLFALLVGVPLIVSKKKILDFAVVEQDKSVGK